MQCKTERSILLLKKERSNILDHDIQNVINKKTQAIVQAYDDNFSFDREYRNPRITREL